MTYPNIDKNKTKKLRLKLFMQKAVHRDKKRQVFYLFIFENVMKLQKHV